MSANQKAARFRRVSEAPRRSNFDRGDDYALAGQYRRKQRIDRKSLHKTFSNDRERSLRIRQNYALFRARIRAEKTDGGSVAQAVIDRDVFLDLQRQLHLGQTVRLSGASGPLVIRRKYPIRLHQWGDISRDIRSKRRKGIHEHLMWVPEWKHTGDHLKALSWAMTIEQQQGRAFTLHLTDKVTATASRHARGFAYHVQQEISRCLRQEMKKLGLKIPDFFFTLEAELKSDADPFDFLTVADDSGWDDYRFDQEGWDASVKLKVHLHGGIVIPDHPDAMDAVRRGLRAAGGFRKAKLTGRELKLDKLYHAAGWAEYVVKWSLQAADILSGTIFGATNPVRSAGREWYQRARREQLAIHPRDHVVDLLTEAMERRAS